MGYSLGSLRDCIVWYQGVRGILSDRVIEERLELMVRIRSLLLGLIRATRQDTSGRTRFEP